MPSKGSQYKSGKRNLILTKEFYNNLRKETGLELDDKTIKQIIVMSNLEISDAISNDEEGIKLPENLGYVVTTKYKGKTNPIDWQNSMKFKKKIFLTNLHSFGYIYHIKWYKKGIANFAYKDIYKFQPARVLKRDIAKQVKSGKVYHMWSNNDFLGKNKILKKFK